MCNGVLAGLVCITASCGNVDTVSSFIIGIFGGFAYVLFSRIVYHCKVDDPLDAFAVHYGAGLTGVILVGFFDKSTGIFYGHNGK
jgi:Amt family ammonium transporter